MSVARLPESQRLKDRSWGAVLIGYDVQGFSRTVQKAALVDGRGAGELAAARILAGQSAIAARVREAGFHPIDSIGDGAIYARRTPAPEPDDAQGLNRLMAELRYLHFQATGLRIRAGWTHGRVQTWAPPVRLAEQGTFVFGPGMARLHACVRLAEADARRSGVPPVVPDTLADREGQIVDRTFAFIRLASADDWAAVDEERLADALGILARWAGGLGGELQRLTHDEKGLHVRIGLPDDVPPGAWGAALASARDALRELGLDGAVGAARGPAYFGPSPDGPALVHGPAVNRAAKLMSATSAGEIALDEGLERTPNAPPAPLKSVGRAGEARAARDWLSGDEARLVLIRGDPGIGKTRLMHDLFDAAPGGVRLWTPGAPSRALRPHGIWREAIREAVARALPELAVDARLGWAQTALAEAAVEPAALSLVRGELGAEAEPDPAVLALPSGARARLAEEALLALALKLADGGLLLAFDDLHLADPASLALIGRALDRGGPIKILATARPSQDPALESLAAHLSTLALRLGPLAARDLGRLVRAVDPGGDPAGVIALSAGNPLAAIQLAAGGAPDSLGADVVQILDRRLDRLSDGEGEVLRAVSTGERAWDPAQIGQMARIEPDRLAATLERLTRNRLVGRAPDGRRVQPAHPLIREAVLRRAPRGVRRRLAKRGAYTLVDDVRRGAHVAGAELAGLWDAAGAGGRAAALYERAAREALDQGGAETAAQLLELALAAAPTADRRLRWMAELASARWSQGQVGASNRIARNVLKAVKSEPLTPRVRATAVLAAAVRAETGQFLGDLGDIFGGAIATHRYATGGREHLEARGRSFGTVAYLLGWVRLGWLAERAIAAGVELSRHSGNPRPKAFVLTGKGIVAYVFTRWAEGDAALLEARDACTNVGEHHLEEVIETTLGMGGHLQGDGARALAHFEALGRRAEARRHKLHEGWAAYAAAQTLLRMGEPHRAWGLLAAAEASLQGSEDRQSHHICQGLRAQLAFHLGQREAALSAAEAAGRTARALPPSNYTSLEAYSAAPLVGALFALSAGSNAERAAGVGLLKRHLGDIVRYATVFPLARPRVAILRALTVALQDPAEARRRLAGAAAFAAARGMGFEARLAADLQQLPALKS